MHRTHKITEYIRRAEYAPRLHQPSHVRSTNAHGLQIILSEALRPVCRLHELGTENTRFCGKAVFFGACCGQPRQTPPAPLEKPGKNEKNRAANVRLHVHSPPQYRGWFSLFFIVFIRNCGLSSSQSLLIKKFSFLSSYHLLLNFSHKNFGQQFRLSLLNPLIYLTFPIHPPLIF